MRRALRFETIAYLKVNRFWRSPNTILTKPTKLLAQAGLHHFFSEPIEREYQAIGLVQIGLWI
ncbi:MAG: hypothetical protein ACFCAD_20240 [Pleurocapsa sp.]